jgi:hypothetical protein
MPRRFLKKISSSCASWKRRASRSCVATRCAKTCADFICMHLQISGLSVSFGARIQKHFHSRIHACPRRSSRGKKPTRLFCAVSRKSSSARSMAVAAPAAAVRRVPARIRAIGAATAAAVAARTTMIARMTTTVSTMTTRTRTRRAMAKSRKSCMPVTGSSSSSSSSSTARLPRRRPITSNLHLRPHTLQLHRPPFARHRVLSPNRRRNSSSLSSMRVWLRHRCVLRRA